MMTENEDTAKKTLPLMRSSTSAPLINTSGGSLAELIVANDDDKVGYLEIILGPMFSGKSSYLAKKYKYKT